jgi:hypothetical protein
VNEMLLFPLCWVQQTLLRPVLKAPSPPPHAHYPQQLLTPACTLSGRHEHKHLRASSNVRQVHAPALA